MEHNDNKSEEKTDFFETINLRPNMNGRPSYYLSFNHKIFSYFELGLKFRF